MKDLFQVINIAILCMFTVLFFGSGYDKLQPVKMRHVECSVRLVDMAKKFNVTLLDECEVSDE